ncbi:hypothetical protein TrVE_jg4587 [Triparma verrucosa]|uniref:Glycosyl transferase 64 domain-containing protein n=1 Tax=Triparma verrucosa TaxID=1606542 RepID=A0A9W7CBV4_9STRA|nr:hypothetical protein TrVE_jg4587 [Triparma verrucosa]
MNQPSRRTNKNPNSAQESQASPSTPPPSIHQSPSPTTPISKPLTQRQKLLLRTLLLILTSCFLDYVNLTLLKSNEPQTPNSTSLRGTRSNSRNLPPLSILLNTVNERDIADILKHYHGCDAVTKVYVIAPTNKANLFADVHQPHDSAEETALKNRLKSLNNRFERPPTLSTDFVMTLDDDIIVPCEDIEAGLKAVAVDDRNHIGFFPRLFNDGVTGLLEYRCWFKVFWASRFSMVLTKASFLHHRYLTLYWRDDYKPVRDYVDNLMNCEDIAMSVLVLREGGKPKYLQGTLTDYGVFSGISTRKNNHMNTRSKCISDILDLANVENPEPIDLRENSFTKYWPGLFFQWRPSTIFEWFSADTIQI